MADDEAWLRRVLRALLVLGGLLFAGWLLGGCAQSAHAEELPPPVEVVQNAHPELKRVLDQKPELPEVVAPRPAVPDVVPVEKVPEVLAPVEVPRRVVRPAAPAAQSAAQVRRPSAPSRAVRAERAVVRQAGVVRQQQQQRHSHVQAPDVRPAPVPMPVRSDTSAGGLSVIGGSAVVPAVSSWVPARPPAAIAAVFGPVPPPVRTAADEPSFAPD
ncbi:hypothetical protein [Actinomadura litoris]|uniref:hypothetical protein n=1 Tax=Actinomadura litoris TaxID=2678616 RepID=UPI001FA6BBB3|nr:hypothetical protein [Actinomadura litoris]